MGSINKFKPKGPIMSELRNFASRPARPTSAAIKNKWGQNKWGHPLAVSGQLAQSNPDASHHFILMAVF